MIRIFTGDDRVRAKKEIEKKLGSDYEVIEGVDLEAADLPTVFYGNSLFSDRRKILIRDLGENKAVWEKLPEYLDSSHEIVLWESKLDKRTVIYKDLAKKIQVMEFKTPQENGYKKSTAVFQMAKKDGKRAVEMLRAIELEQEPMLFLGTMVSEAVKEYALRQGASEKKTLKALSRLDMELKSTAIEPWLLIEGFLLRLASL